MSGFGLMPFGSGPFGGTTNDSQPLVRAQIPSSRNIDAYGRFTQTEDSAAGGYDGMGDSMQRALVLLGLNFRAGKKITADWESTTAADLRTVLAPLAGSISVEQIVTGEIGTTNGAEIHLRDLANDRITVYRAIGRTV
jgi:hypothetical protein